MLTLLLILTSLLGYLEWGDNQHLFLFQAEADIFLKMWTKPAEVIHPFTVLPLFGQFILLFTFFQKNPSAIWIWLGMAGIGLLLGLMFVIGLISLNYKIGFSTLPFLIVCFLMIRRSSHPPMPFHSFQPNYSKYRHPGSQVSYARRMDPLKKTLLMTIRLFK